ncbi:MAG: PstS family phosphate ABC transporter substrate-binding protein [Myxococcaceae bacterium]
MLFCLLWALLGLLGCHSAEKSIQIDGSSTVFPISEAVVEEFQKTVPGKITIGVSGTGGGFKKFCAGNLSIAAASRAISDSEKKHCAENKIAYRELKIAYDGIVLVVHPENSWVSDISLEELKAMWEPQAQNRILFWNQLNPVWPKKPIHLFAPGVDSGTYDYFTKAIVGKEHASRGDITSSEDDNVLIQGISTDPLALGFIGFGYYSENQNKLKALSVKGVMPSFENILNKKYVPLSRPLFLYVAEEKLKQKKVRDFINFYLHNSDLLIKEVGYVPLEQQSSL